VDWDGLELMRWYPVCSRSIPPNALPLKCPCTTAIGLAWWDRRSLSPPFPHDRAYGAKPAPSLPLEAGFSLSSGL
jgi:hypothetical protein